MNSPAFRRAAAAFALLALAAPPAAAADASAWHRGPHSAVRLVNGNPYDALASPVMRAGVEIALDRGWKTYWRYPGDSGVAPRFDFSGSVNVRKVTVLWPAPMRFPDGGGTAIGYAGRVVLPLRVTARNPRAWIELRLRLDYAVCERLCVPDVAELRLTLPGRPDSPHMADLDASAARVPVPAALGGEGPLAVVALRRMDTGKAPRVEVDLRAPAGEAVDLFAEGPTEDWSLPLPEPVDGAPAGLKRFAFALDGLPAGETGRGAVLRLIAVTARHAIEVAAPLD